MYTYQEEYYDYLIEELKPLLEEHYKEVAMYQDVIELNPDYEFYKLAADRGDIHFYTCRVQETDELVGYCVTFIKKHPHYSDHVYAMNDIVYVHPDHRHTEVAPTMLQNLEYLMKEDGVSVMTFHMKTYKPFETLMTSLSYDKAEMLFMKLIKE